MEEEAEVVDDLKEIAFSGYRRAVSHGNPTVNMTASTSHVQARGRQNPNQHGGEVVDRKSQH